MLHRESCLSPKLSEYCKRIGSRYFVTTSGEERVFPAFDGESFPFDVISESLHVRAQRLADCSPSRGCRFR